VAVVEIIAALTREHVGWEQAEGMVTVGARSRAEYGTKRRGSWNSGESERVSAASA